jgi:ATP-dependent Lon protease
MKESATIAWNISKRNMMNWEFLRMILKKKNIHVHVPEGATPKDGLCRNCDADFNGFFI